MEEALFSSPANHGATLNPIDLSIIIAYFVATLGIGFWVSRGQKSSGDYFLGARDLPAWGVLLSIVAICTLYLRYVKLPQEVAPPQ